MRKPELSDRQRDTIRREVDGLLSKSNSFRGLTQVQREDIARNTRSVVEAMASQDNGRRALNADPYARALVDPFDPAAPFPPANPAPGPAPPAAPTAPWRPDERFSAE